MLSVVLPVKVPGPLCRRLIPQRSRVLLARFPLFSSLDVIVNYATKRIPSLHRAAWGTKLLKTTYEPGCRCSKKINFIGRFRHAQSRTRGSGGSIHFCGTLIASLDFSEAVFRSRSSKFNVRPTPICRPQRMGLPSLVPRRLEAHL